jgi:hypothetical protein
MWQSHDQPYSTEGIEAQGNRNPSRQCQCWPAQLEQLDARLPLQPPQLCSIHDHNVICWLIFVDGIYQSKNGLCHVLLSQPVEAQNEQQLLAVVSESRLLMMLQEKLLNETNKKYY